MTRNKPDSGDNHPATCNDELSANKEAPMPFTAISLATALTMEPAEISGVIDGIPVNPSEPPAIDIPNECRSSEELMLWWRQPYLVWNKSGHWEVRCLDGGAWDRPSYLGQNQALATAIALATKPTRAYAIGELQAKENGHALMKALGVVVSTPTLR